MFFLGASVVKMSAQQNQGETWDRKIVGFWFEQEKRKVRRGFGG